MSSIIEASANLRKRKQLKRGINFTMLVVGPSGCGRSTFINTLCGQQVVECGGQTFKNSAIQHEIKEQVEVDLRHEMVELEDDEGVKIQLNIVDTPGFGCSLDNTFNFEIVSDYIKHQYDEILLEESRVKRNPRFRDGRVHVLLYFIEPTGHGLKEFDILFIKKIGALCNIIPVISKSDSLTVDELKKNKKLIVDDLEKFDLPVFDFLGVQNEEDLNEEDYETNVFLKKLLPFSIIGSNDIFNLEDGTQIRGRKYPWGMIDVEDANVSDFVILRNTLLISHLNDLKEYTHQVLYENYRTETLSGTSSKNNYNTNSNSNTSSNDNNSTSSNNNNSIYNERNVSHSSNKDTPDSFKSLDRDSASTQNGTNNSMKNGSNNNSYLAKEEQIRLEEERLKAFEERVQQELQLKRQELLKREQELREIEERLELESKLNRDE